ncbi:MAG TPA: WD40 repeat domain-containing protein [Desulfuromonadales bacterium]|nr:WD40 repeat domain-containing protein [Desulfuromonadales bacterium]
MNAVLKYLAFVGILAAAFYAAATLDLSGGRLPRSAQPGGIIAGKTAASTSPSLSGKPSHLLGGLQGHAVVDFSTTGNLTAVAVGDTIKLWRLPDENPLIEIDAGDNFQLLALKFIPAKGLLAAGGATADGAGGIRLFEITSGKITLQLEEPEPVTSLDLHPGGGFLLATARRYLKVIDIKDGAAVALLPKDSPVSRGWFYGGGSEVLLSASLAVVDVNTQKQLSGLDSVPPLMSRKSGSSGRVSWLTAEGIATQAAPNGTKELFPLQLKGVIAFDIAPGGSWGLFLQDDRKLVARDFAAAKDAGTVLLPTPAVDVSIAPDGNSAAVAMVSGDVAIYDIGSKNRIRNLRFRAAQLLQSTGEKLSGLLAGFRK